MCAKHLHGFHRLAEVYGLVERMHSVDLRVAADAVSEAVSALETQRTVAQAQIEQGQAALREGDRQAWAMAASQAELAGLQQVKVEQLRQGREATRTLAMQTYQASRVRLEQMVQMVRKARAQEAKAEDRRMQTALDDGHLARRGVVRANDEEQASATDRMKQA